MTNKEAIDILHNATVYHPNYLDALIMAIEALEKQDKIAQILDDCDLLESWEVLDDYDLLEAWEVLKMVKEEMKK